MIRIGVVDAIEEADSVANRERKVIGVSAAISGLDDLDVVAEVTGATSVSTDGGADFSRVGVCRRGDGDSEIGASVVRLEALAPKPGDVLDGRFAAAGDEHGSPVLLLHLKRFGCSPATEQIADFALPLGFLTDRGKDLGNGFVAERIA